MRIAVAVDPYIPVPPIGYGGIERTVDYVCRGLSARGHQITLFAHPESKTAGELIGYGVPPHRGIVPRVRELLELGGALFRRRREFDVVINWGRLAALLPILPIRSLPKIQRYCRDQVPWTSVRRATVLAGDSIIFAGASTSVYTTEHGIPAGRWVTVFDGVELEKYTFVPELVEDAPLCFIGRVCPVKGPHVAIAVAKAAGRRLVIAGNREHSGADPLYFEREIAPHLDGDQITYIGTVNDAQKDALLGRSYALLFPTAFKEAFGIVMAEALACGTPVLASPRGSVREVIDEGISGFVCETISDYLDGLGKIKTLSRESVRRRCEERFDSDLIVQQIEQLCVRMAAKTF